MLNYLISLSKRGQSALGGLSIVIHERLAVQGVAAEPLLKK